MVRRRTLPKVHGQSAEQQQQAFCSPAQPRLASFTLPGPGDSLLPGGGGGDVETLHGVLLRGPGRAFWHLLLTPGHPKKPGITCRLAYGMALAGSWVCKEETLLCDALSQNPDVGAEDAFIKL